MLSALLLATGLATKTPVTILSGFLGAGKTTTLSHLLSNTDGLRLGVVVNDVAKLNIDAALISKTAAETSENDGDVVKLQNGCACCSLSDELTAALRSLSATGDFDHIIVELSGVANPDTAKQNLKEALAADGTLGVALDRVVTLVDSSTFLSYFESEALVANTPELREMSADDDDTPIDKCADRKGVPQLLVNQVDAADVLVVNKLDLVSPDERGLVEKLLRAFNPKAQLQGTQFGELPSDALVITTALARAAAARRAAETASETDGAAEPPGQRPAAAVQPQSDTQQQPSKSASPKPKGWNKFMPMPSSPVTDALGIYSFVYTARRPFESGRLFALLDQWQRDYASPLQKVNLQLGSTGSDATAAISQDSDAEARARAAEDAAAEAKQKQLDAYPNLPALRLTVGDRVECDVKGTWAAGAVAAVYVTRGGEAYTPGDDVDITTLVPYQVLLDDGRNIGCTDDDESFIRLATGDAAVAPAHPFGGVLRSKGWAWLDQMPTKKAFWSHAGRSVELTQEDPWWKAAGEVNMRRKLGTGSRYEEAKSLFEGAYGDCRQDLVFIGTEPMDEEAIRRALDGCLLKSKEEFGAFQQAWREATVVAPSQQLREQLEQQPETAWWQRGLLKP